MCVCGGGLSRLGLGPFTITKNLGSPRHHRFSIFDLLRADSPWQGLLHTRLGLLSSGVLSRMGILPSLLFFDSIPDFISPPPRHNHNSREIHWRLYSSRITSTTAEWGGGGAVYCGVENRRSFPRLTSFLFHCSLFLVTLVFKGFLSSSSSIDLE